MVGLMGKKVGMTQMYTEDGSLVSVTVVQAGPCRVMQKKEKAKEGYDSLQIGFEPMKESRATKPHRGHCAKSSGPTLKYLREFRVEEGGAYQVGQEIKVDLFKVGDLVDVIGISKGKGFAGVMKRHGFRGGARSHGSMFHRAPGSIGSSSYPSRVFKGMRMAGHMGNARITVKNLKVLRVDPENNLLLIMGPVPGSKNGLLVITSA